MGLRHIGFTTVGLGLVASVALVTIGCSSIRDKLDQRADAREFQSLFPVIQTDVDALTKERAFVRCEFRWAGPKLPLQNARPRTWVATLLVTDPSGHQAFYTIEYDQVAGHWARTRMWTGLPEDPAHARGTT